MLVAAPTKSDASPIPCSARNGSSPQRESISVQAAVATAASNAPRIIV
jgi:hypothetical protein